VSDFIVIEKIATFALNLQERPAKKTDTALKNLTEIVKINL